MVRNITFSIFISLLFLLAPHEASAQILPSSYREQGLASYYASSFHGLLTANGEVFNSYDFTAAHKELPFNTILLVTNLRNSSSVVVRVNDRGPYIKNRIIDLSHPAAKRIGMMHRGVARVDVQELNVIQLTDDKEKIFNKNSLLDINGKPAELSNYSINVWDSFSLEHVIYMVINLRITMDINDIYIQGKGHGSKQRYTIYISKISTREEANSTLQRLRDDGFTKARLAH